MEGCSKIAIIADADTMVGFEIAGVANDPNFPTLIRVAKTDPREKIAGIYEEQMRRKDIAIIFICDFASSKIKREIVKNKTALPSVLIIPSKSKF